MTENLFGNTAPVQGDLTDGQPISLGTIIIPSVDGTITHIRWRAPATASGIQVRGALYRYVNELSGTLLSGPKDFGPITNGSYNQVALDAPVPVTAGTKYVAVVYTDRYTATNSFFNASGFSNGLHLSAPQDTAGQHNGRFIEPSAGLSYPDSSFQSTCYFVDVVFELGDTIVPDQPSVALALTPLTVPGPTPVTVADSPSVALGAAPSATAPQTALSDDSIFPVLDKALTCVVNEMARTLTPPKYASIRPGVNFVAGIANNGALDECCEGSTWVRFVNAFPTQNFPEQVQLPSAYQQLPGSMAVTIEFGAARCAPVANPQGKDFPTATQWRATASAVMDDLAALRRAACCLRGQVLDLVFGQENPMPQEGNCVGVTLQVTVKVPFCC